MRGSDIRGIFLASLGHMVRRRATLVGLGGLILLLSIPAVTSYSELRDLRHFRRLAMTAEIDPVTGLICDKGREPEFCRSVPRPPEAQAELSDAERRVIGERMRPVAIEQFTALEKAAERELTARATAKTRAKSLGTLFGVVFAILLGATLIGAEWRWGVWRQQLPRQPQRGLLLAGKFAALWATVALVATAAFSAVLMVDLVMRLNTGIDATNGPALADVTGQLAKAQLSLVAYASFAGTAATLFRSSLAGLAGPLFLLGADGWLTRRPSFFRHILPAQQVVALMPPEFNRNTPDGTVWWQPTAGSRCEQYVCFADYLPLIPSSRAVLVLTAWIGAVALLTGVRLYSQDLGGQT